MKKLVMIAATLVVVLSGCNTINGLGKDIQRAGESIEDAARKK